MAISSKERGEERGIELGAAGGWAVYKYKHKYDDWDVGCMTKIKNHE